MKQTLGEKKPDHLVLVEPIEQGSIQTPVDNQHEREIACFSVAVNTRNRACNPWNDWSFLIVQHFIIKELDARTPTESNNNSDSIFLFKESV